MGNSRSLILILILSFSLRVFLLDFESLWLDEGSSIRFAKLGVAEIFKSTQTDAHPPLYYLLLHFWIKIFGDSDFSIRFPSVIFGFLAVLAVYKFCFEFWSKEVALMSSPLMGISTFQVFYSQEARMYSLLCLLSILSFFYFMKILKEGRFKFYILYSVVNVFLVYTHLYSFFVLFAHMVYVIFAERKKLKGFVLSFIFVFMFYIPRFLIVLNQAKNVLLSGEFWLPRPGFLDLLKTLAQFAGATYPMPRDDMGNVILWRFIAEYLSAGVLLVMMIGLAFLSVFKFGKFHHDKSKVYAVLLLWFFSPILIPFILSQFMTPFYFTRYAIASSVALYVLVSIGLENFNSDLKTRLLGLMIFLSVVNLAWYYGKTNKEQWREVVKFIEAEAGDEDLVIASKYVFYHYVKKKELDTFEFPDVGETERREIIGKLRSLMPKYKRIWLVSSHSPELEELIVKILSNSMKITLRKKFLGVDVFLFEKR